MNAMTYCSYIDILRNEFTKKFELYTSVMEILEAVWQYFQSHTLEFVAAFFGVVSVWYSRKNDILVYPTGIVSVLLYVYICLIHKLYADAGVNFYYFVMSVVGWVNWSKKKEEEFVFPISYCDRNEWIKGIAVFLIILISLLFFLFYFTDSTTVVGDSLVSASAATAMWWMAKRKIESWYAWILSNIVALPLFFVKELHFTVVQYIVFLYLAVWGLITWRKEFKKGYAKL